VLVAAFAATTAGRLAAQAPADSLVLSCEAMDQDHRCTLYGTSVLQLIARPDLFDGKRVRVIGYIHWEFEGNALYVHAEDERHSLNRNGLWVEMAATATPDSACQDRYVLVEGTFRARHHGHLGLWSGAITGITRCMAWR